MNIIHRDIKITGVVQGVFFRQSCSQKAKELNINGWVKNEPDGSVSVSAEGEKNHVEDLIRWCYSGPPLAQIENIDIKDGAIQNYPDFAIY